jgi:hypothetical protein
MNNNHLYCTISQYTLHRRLKSWCDIFVYRFFYNWAPNFYIAISVTVIVLIVLGREASL